MFHRILIANRGEIAVRIIRTCREMEIETVAVYSTADAEALHVKLATRAVCIGPARAADSYLNLPAILTVAVETGCDAIHPGYGFLSENAELADLCAECGLKFIGPGGDVIRTMGNKAAARMLMRENRVPVVPGSDGPVRSLEQAAAVARAVGYPVLVKASSGGGGRGMRRVDAPEVLPGLYAAAQAEAVACFGDGELYVEKLILHPRHFEFQVLADSHGNVVHLGERDCSIQRKNQKLVEESPSRGLDADLRQAMGAAAVRAAQCARYQSAGTVEFVLDGSGAFYFIEMNTRIQVEHPVTEMITGVDLVREQIRIAAGLPLGMTQSEVRQNGHAGSTPRIRGPDSGPDRGPRGSFTCPADPVCGWTRRCTAGVSCRPSMTHWRQRWWYTPTPAWRRSAGCGGRWRKWSLRAIPPPPISAILFCIILILSRASTTQAFWSGIWRRCYSGRARERDERFLQPAPGAYDSAQGAP